jgi:dTDP-4-dehydrorhamnose reductase
MAAKVVVIGANGALGTDLMDVLENPVAATHADFDICDKDAATAFLKEANPDAVVNTAAFHQVPMCETETGPAYEVNTLGSRNLAEICKEIGAHFVHISTDYVFDGKKGQPYVETDLPAPLSIYAITKLAGEHTAFAYGDRVSVVRSCGLYGEVPTRAKGGNFVTTMMKLGKERDLVTVVDDEIVAPTYTYDLAIGIDHLIQSRAYGLFHLSNQGATTWYDFARVIWEEAKLAARLEPTKAAAFQSVVQRPAYSILDNSKFEKATGHQLPHWEDALRRHLKKLLQK